MEFNNLRLRTITSNKNANDLLRGKGSPSLIKYCFCHMKHARVFKHFHCTLSSIDIKPISLGFSGKEFKNHFLAAGESQVCRT